MTNKNQVDMYLDQSPEIGFLLTKVQGLYRARLVQAIEGHGMHIGHIQLLSALQKLVEKPGTPLTQTRLGKITGIEKSSLVLLLDDMEKRGWVQRLAHSSDRRAYVIAMTSVGVKRYAAISKILHACEQEILSFLSKSQRAVFVSFLTELIQKLES